MNKKGVLTTYLLVFVIISVGLGLSLVTGKDVNFIAMKGDSQAETMEVYILGEKDLFKFERESKVKLENAIFDLADKGGRASGAGVEGYSYWQRGSKKCYPPLEDLVENLKMKLNTNLKYGSDLITVPYVYEKKYSLSIDNATVEYFVNSSLELEYMYSLDKFVESVGFVEMIVSECEKNVSCWNSKGLNVESLNEGNTFKIEVTSQNIPRVIENKELNIKGAVDFEYNPLIEGEFEC